MLFGLIAAAAPILLHMFRKRTARRIVWGAWQFLAESMRQKRRRILIEEIILLVVRTAILALAALAFARPFLPEMGFFGGGEKDVVIVLDASGSMNLKRKDGTTAFEAAVEEARELIDRAPHGVSFGLVLGGRDAEIRTATPFSAKREILKLLEDVKAGNETMDVPRALEAAGEVLSGGSHVDKEVILFGDGQAYGWRADDVNAWRRVEKVFSNFHRRPPVVWRTLERPEGVKNAAIASVIPSRQIFGTDRPVTFSVTVVNSGSTPFSPGELSLAVDDRRLASQPVGQVLPGLSRTIPFTCSFTNNGPHTVIMALAGEDDILSDNVVTNPVQVIDELKVLLVNGRPGSTGFERPTAYVEAALRPEMKDDKTPFLVKPVSIRPAELETTNTLSDVAVTILCDVPFLSEKAADNLARWTSEGGGLLAVPGERAASAGFYTNWTWKSQAVMPAAWTNFAKSAADTKPPLFEGASIAGRMLFDEKGMDTNRASVVSRMSDGEPAVVTGAFGRGRIGMLAMPLDLEWTSLPARPTFVPFAHDVVYSLSARRSVADTTALAWNAREGDVAPLTANETDDLMTRVDLSFARLKDDVSAAVMGRGFGVEIWRPLAIIVLLLMLIEVLLCRYIDNSRAGEGQRPRRSVACLVLRILAVLALLWMLAHVIWVHDRTRKVSRKVALLVDHSLSMRRHGRNEDGSTNTFTRLDVATNAAARLETALSGKYDIESFSFGDEVTDYAAALEEVRARIPSEELAGAVFVTDGRPTAGADVEAVSRLFARQGAKISSVIVGNVTNRPDLAIQEVWAPESLFLGEKVHALVTLRAEKLKGTKTVVRFLLGDKELDHKDLEIDSDEWTKDFRFSDEPKEKGTFHYRVVVESPDRDFEKENDVWPFDVAVSDDRTNVLIADRRPRWEFRYLRNLFYGRDKSVHLQYVLTEPDRLAGEQKVQLAAADATRKFGDAEAGCLPSGRDSWRKFDVMIFGDLDPELILDEEVADIRSCIEERGAMVVFIAGGKYMPLAYAKGPLAELLPVSLTNAEGRVAATWHQGRFGFSVTGAGYAHEIMSLSSSDAENVRIWESGCEWNRRLDGLTLKPGAETLAFASDSSALKAPLLVVQHRGRGKVVFLASDETWRFRYRIGDTYHHKFWGNMLAWGSGVKLRDGNAFARIGTERLHYAPGEPVKICVRLSDADSLPMDDLKVTCTITNPNGEKRELALLSRNQANGSYEGVYEETSVLGDYHVEATCKDAQAKLGDKWPKPFVTSFAVKSSFAPVEYTHQSSDRTVADEMAKFTSGSVVMLYDATNVTFTFASSTTNRFTSTTNHLPTTTNQLPSANYQLPTDFGSGRSEVVDHVENHIWDHPLGFIVMAVALILVWILRKRRGLI